ncbi:MAG: sulfotransferase [Bacteroidota bacterium]
MEQTIFIVGVGRSGTSMLMTLLNGHSKIAFTPETHFLRFYVGSQEIQAEFEAKGVTKFKEIIDQDDYYKRLHIDSSELLAPYLKEKKVFDLRAIYKEILSTYLRRKDKTYIGDKDPRYIDYLPIIKEIYPNAKIIHIYRDPRDIVLSKTKADWSAHRPYWMNAIISQVQIKKGRKKIQELFDGHFYELSYESLVANPNESLTKLLAFLDLELEKEMLDLRKSAEELVDKAEMQWKNNTFKPVMNANKEKWRKGLSTSQIRCTEIICKEWFKNLGYGYSKVKINFMEELFYQLIFAAQNLQELVYDRQLSKQMKKTLLEAEKN